MVQVCALYCTYTYIYTYIYIYTHIIAWQFRLHMPCSGHLHIAPHKYTRAADSLYHIQSVTTR
jgi:hypothetical protein